MAETTFTNGSAAACSDGPCGAVSRVVVDPVAREVTHLVVEPEHRSGLGRLVPLDLVTPGAGEVRLRCTREEFDQLPPAEETDFLPGGSGYEDYEAHDALLCIAEGKLIADSERRQLTPEHNFKRRAHLSPRPGPRLQPYD